jgi:hypothetical protein
MSLEFPQELQDQLVQLLGALQQTQKVWVSLDIKLNNPEAPGQQTDLSEVMRVVLGNATVLLDMTNQYAKMISTHRQTLLDHLETEAKAIEAYGERKWSDNEIGRARGYREVAEMITSGSYLMLEDDSDVEENPPCPCPTAS